MNLSHLLEGFTTWKAVTKEALEYVGVDTFEEEGIPYPTMQCFSKSKRYDTFWFYSPTSDGKGCVSTLAYDAFFDTTYILVEPNSLFLAKIAILRKSQHGGTSNMLLPTGNQAC